ncbi:MAG: hypothetical protein R2867_15360 [Caldilineaceae bacterium]
MSLPTPGECTTPIGLAGLDGAACRVTTTVATTAQHNDEVLCAVTATAVDDDGGTVTVTEETERYLVVSQPTWLDSGNEPAASTTHVFLPWISGRALPEE